MKLPTPERIIIGDAVLWHADCRDVPLESGSIDFIFTDPPYGHNNNDGDLIANRALATGRLEKNTEARPIANDGAETNDLVRWLFAESARLLARGGCCCCCCSGGGGPDPAFARWSLWMDEAIEFKQMVVWDKGPMGLGWHYRRSYEVVLVGQKPGGACAWYDASGKIENIIRPGQYGASKLIPSVNDHPTPKPSALAAHFIRLHSIGNETVLDPFMGAGSTGVAAIQQSRKFIGIELERRWFDLACERIDRAQKQGRLFADPVQKPTQHGFAFS